MKELTKYEEFISEFLGTCVLILFGCGVGAMTTLFQSASSPITMGGYTNITLGWGFAVTMGIYIGAASGAHLNPAVTLGMAAIGKFPIKKIPHYILAQFLGAFVGALIVFVVYYYKWIEFDPNFEKTAGVFATFPAVSGFLPGFIDQVVGTFLLVFVILGIGDKFNPSGALSPILVGFLVMAIGISFGGMHGYAINPARDFGPRLFATIAGFKNNGLTDSFVWVVPIIGPIVGGILGAIVYQNTIAKISARVNK